MKYIFHIFFLFLILGNTRDAFAVDCNNYDHNIIGFSLICNSEQLSQNNHRINQFLQKQNERLNSLRLRAEQDKDLQTHLSEKQNMYNILKRLDSSYYDKAGKCTYISCLKVIQEKTLEEMEKALRNPQCPKINLDPQCEIYAYNKDNPRQKSSKIILSDEEPTYLDKIKINRPEKCVYLFLSAYYPVVFEITASKNTEIKTIIAGGRQPMFIQGYSSKTKVIYTSAEINSNSDEQCFNTWYRGEEIYDKLEKMGIAKEKIKLVNSNFIGDNAASDEFEYFEDNHTGTPMNVPLLPEDDGWKQLIRQKIARPLIQSDFDKLKDAGIISLDTKDVITDQSKYRHILNSQYGYFHDNAYILLEPIDALPKTRTNREPAVFIPYDLPVYRDIKLRNFFGSNNDIHPMSNKNFLIIAPAEEVKKW